MKKNRINANTVIALAALFTSVVAVFVAWDESRLLRQSQRAAFLPIIEVERSINTAPGTLSISLSIRNSGQGVAMVQAADLLIDGKSSDDYLQISHALFGNLADQADFSWTSFRGYYQPGEKKTAMRFSWPDSPEMRLAVETMLGTELADNNKRLSLHLCYCSVFEKCWWQRDEEFASQTKTRNCPKTGSDPMDNISLGYMAADSDNTSRSRPPNSPEAAQ